MSREFNDAQGQLWTARQVGVFLDPLMNAAALSSEALGAGAADLTSDVALRAEIEFRAANGACVRAVMADGELGRASEETLRDVLEKALGRASRERIVEPPPPLLPDQGEGLIQ